MGAALDLNADMGEGMGDDAALMGIVTSANIACGGHAGDADTMARTMQLALEAGVGLGAHPGFFDRAGFGRKRLALSAWELANLTAYQVGAAQGIATRLGGKLRHVKLHGALANMASEDLEIARACFQAARQVQPGIVLMAMAATAQEAAAQALGGPWAGEIFADRAYAEDGTLVDRSQPGAVLHDAVAAAERVRAMQAAGAIITQSGKRIPTRIDSVCVHGDTPEAVAMAAAIRARLGAAGITLAAL